MNQKNQKRDIDFEVFMYYFERLPAWKQQVWLWRVRLTSWLNRLRSWWKY